MVGRVARGVHRLDGPILALDDVAVLDGDIRPEVEICAFLDLRHVAVAAMRAVAVGRGVGLGLEQAHRRRMVAMGVGYQDMRHRLTLQRVQQRRHVLFVQWAGVDHCDLAAADDVGAGALEGEGAGILRHDPADHRRQDRNAAVGEIQFAIEG